MIPGLPPWVSVVVFLLGGGTLGTVLQKILEMVRSQDQDQAATADQITDSAIKLVTNISEQLERTQRDLADETEKRRAAERRIELLEKRIHELETTLGIAHGDGEDK